MWQLIWQVALIAGVQNYHVPKDTRALNAYIYCLVLLPFQIIRRFGFSRFIVFAMHLGAVW
jgi:hypothetical protein